MSAVGKQDTVDHRPDVFNRNVIVNRNAALKQLHSDPFYHLVSRLISPFTVAKHRKTHISLNSYNIGTYENQTDNLFLRLKGCIFPVL